MRLIYMLIQKTKRTIDHMELNFSQDFEVHCEENQLIINKRNNVVRVFPESICDLTAIVGKNGSGKSTILDLMFLSKRDDIFNILDEGNSHARLILLYHIEDNPDQGRFYLREYATRPMFYRMTNMKESYTKSQYHNYIFTYDYLNSQILSSEEAPRRMVHPNTYILNHPVVKARSWYDGSNYSDIRKDYIPRYLLNPSRYTLMNYLYDSAISISDHKSCFESVPRGLEFLIDIDLSSDMSNMEPIYLKDWAYREYNDKDIQRIINFLRVAMKKVLFQIIPPQKYLTMHMQQIDEIYAKALQLYKAYNNDSLDPHVAIYIAVLLTSCMDYKVELPEVLRVKTIKISPYMISCFLSLVLAFFPEEYSPYIDYCFQGTVLGEMTGFTESQKDMWESAYRILQSKPSHKVFSDINWKHPIPASCLRPRGNGKYQITIPVASYKKAPNASYGNPPVILDTFFRLLYIFDHLEQYHFSQDDKRFFAPKVNIQGLSTGELEFADLFASIYGGLGTIYNNNPKKEPDIEPTDTVIIILDEPDATFHPEWSRRFIKAFTDILQEEPFCHYPCRYQIILTTHSPIMLSDIPSANIHLLDTDADGRTICKPSSYGIMSNINDIMVSSFFVERPFGTFAEEYVNHVIDDIRTFADVNATSSRSETEIWAAIDIISEPYVRSILTRQFEDALNRKRDEVKMLELQIHELQARLERLKEQKSKKSEDNKKDKQ